MTWWSGLSLEASESLSYEINTSTLFSAVPDSSNMYLNKDSNLISDPYYTLLPVTISPKTVGGMCYANIRADIDRVKTVLVINQSGAGKQKSMGL